MDSSKTPAQDMSAMVAQNVEQARKAMENYLQFFQNGMSVSPWAGTDLSRKLVSYTQQNVAAALEFAQRLTKAKDLQDVVQIQTEFFQSQLKSLTEQTKDIGEAAAKTAEAALKGRPNS
jgi:phasin